ncbi:protein transport inhibitor response 1 [Phtheirospermum japonicum]|uniref:Protein transport inhibitor response 1 n=1 Tax=Phtheirospermum japonicum TaxID=374723 RepID=A0A830C189_9LAMI|nr:protein transport inhibitor response 1 [Phtheirospermum japonicum]
MAYSFPEEVLEHVFSFLSSDRDRSAVSLVCKSWYEIERWCRRRVFIGNCYAVSPEIMIRRFPEVRAVEMKGKPHFADFNLVPEGWGAYVHPWIRAMSAAYPLLEEIKLKRMVVTDESLEQIARSFKNFRVLVLSSCEGFTTDGLASIAANCRNLRELDLKETEVEDLSGHWLSHFPDNCTSLVSLNISCLDLEVSFSALERLVARCPNLRTLRLNRDVPLEKLPTLLHRAPQLVELGTGAYSAEIRPDIFSNLTEAFSACKQLKALSGFWDVVPDYLPAMYSACSGITSLNLSYATVRSPDLVKLISQCRHLQRLWVCDSLISVILE